MTDGALLAADLAKEMRQLQASVADAEAAFSNGHLRRATRDDVVELALVRALGVFEEFVGDLFYLALQQRLGPEVVPLVVAHDRAEAVLLVAGSDGADESKYVTWTPFKDKAIKRADRLLSAGQPFARLASRSSEKAALSDLTVVRNRIAHDSSSARTKFVDLASSRGYPHVRGADYLTSIRGADSEISLGLARLQAIGEGLSEPTELGSRAILAPEDPYTPTQMAPPGVYECVRNQHRVSLATYMALGNCLQCPRPMRCAHCGRLERVDSAWERIA